MRHHLECEVRERIAAGMQPDEARRSALIDFGGIERFKEEGRDARGRVASKISFATSATPHACSAAPPVSPLQAGDLRAWHRCHHRHLQRCATPCCCGRFHTASRRHSSRYGNRTSAGARRPTWCRSQRSMCGGRERARSAEWPHSCHARSLCRRSPRLSDSWAPRFRRAISRCFAYADPRPRLPGWRQRCGDPQRRILACAPRRGSPSNRTVTVDLRRPVHHRGVMPQNSTRQNLGGCEQQDAWLPGRNCAIALVGTLPPRCIARPAGVDGRRGARRARVCGGAARAGVTGPQGMVGDGGPAAGTTDRRRTDAADCDNGGRCASAPVGGDQCRDLDDFHDASSGPRTGDPAGDRRNR